MNEAIIQTDYGRDLERSASQWLGTLLAEAAEQPLHSSNLDRLTHAWLGRITAGLSPASLIAAYQDWLAHLATSPAKQLELLEKAWRKLHRWNLYAWSSHLDDCSPCIDPLPQDRRFSDPQWQRWPYNLIYQGFLLTQQWWWNATTGIRGVSRHHEEVLTFVARQLLDMMSPSDFVLTNPVVLEETIRQGGMNLVQGASNALEDLQRNAAGKRPQGAETYRVGKDVAITPGKIVP